MTDLQTFAKTAAAPLVDPGPARQAAVRGDAFKRLGHLLLGGLAVGGAARGGVGLYNAARRNMAPRPKSPVTVLGDEEEKQASPQDIAGQIPWYAPAAATAAVGGLYGGWTALDKLMDSRRKAEQDDELATAKMNFRQALSDPSGVKTAETNELGRELDGLFDEVKQAMAPDGPIATQLQDKSAAVDWNAVKNKAINGYGLYALLAAGTTGAYAYNRAKKRTGPAVLDAATKRRQRMRHLARPTGIQTQVHLPPAAAKEEEEAPAGNGMLGFDTSPTSRRVDRQY